MEASSEGVVSLHHNVLHLSPIYQLRFHPAQLHSALVIAKSLGTYFNPVDIKRVPNACGMNWPAVRPKSLSCNTWAA
jgi:hypothetical protein